MGKNSEVMPTIYTKRDTAFLDEAGGYYTRHLEALNVSKVSNASRTAFEFIASELAYRDCLIDQLNAAVECYATGGNPTWTPGPLLLARVYERALRSAAESISELKFVKPLPSVYAQPSELGFYKGTLAAKEVVEKAASIVIEQAKRKL